jgi:hypothetical protein
MDPNSASYKAIIAKRGQSLKRHELASISLRSKETIYKEIHRNLDKFLKLGYIENLELPPAVIDEFMEGWSEFEKELRIKRKYEKDND